MSISISTTVVEIQKNTIKLETARAQVSNEYTELCTCMCHE